MTHRNVGHAKRAWFSLAQKHCLLDVFVLAYITRFSSRKEAAIKARIIVTLDDGNEVSTGEFNLVQYPTPTPHPPGSSFVASFTVIHQNETHGAHNHLLHLHPTSPWNENLFLRVRDVTWCDTRSNGVIRNKIGGRFSGFEFILDIVEMKSREALYRHVRQRTRGTSIGEKSMDYVERRLNEMGLSYGMEIPGARAELNRRIAAGEV